MFQQLLELFKPVFDKYTLDDNADKLCPLAVTPTGGLEGRKRDIDAIGCLGVMLFCYQKICGSVARAVA